MEKRMKAVVKIKPEHGGVLQDVPVPSPGPGEVLVKVKATAICGTDVHIYQWNKWAQGAVKNFPQTMGHEFSGVVEALGEGVTSVAVGDHVAGETHGPCGKCYQCLNGQQHICANMMLFGVHCDGCFAQYTVLPEICARKIPETLPWDHAAMMEPLGTSVRSAMEAEPAGAVVAVIGAGPIGLGAITALKALGATTVIASDVSKERLSVAREVGADHCFDPSRDDLVSEVMKLTDNVGVDAFIDASGNSRAIAGGFDFLRKGGRVILVGLPSEPFTIDLGPKVIFKEATVIGIHGRKMFSTWTVMENLMEAGLLKLEPIITHTMPLDRFDEGFALLEEGKGCKIILDPWAGE
jgi:threonine 3-dehydrogenase